MKAISLWQPWASAIPAGSDHAMTHCLHWDRQGRKGQKCQILSAGRMRTVVIRFEDGYRMATSARALRRIR